MEHAVLPAARSRQAEFTGGDRRAGLALRTFPDLVLAAHRAPRRARGREPRAQGDYRYAERPRPCCRGRPGLVGGPAHRRLEDRPPPPRRRQSPGHAGLRSRTVRAQMTWSIIARDSATGRFGIAVAT